MSKRAEQAALKAYPIHSVLIQPARRGGYYADNHLREGYIEGYEQAEKDTIKRVVKWLKDNHVQYPNRDIRTEELVGHFRRYFKED